MRKSTAPIFPLLLAALCGLLVSSCGSKKDVQATASATPEIPTVAVAKVATADLSRDLILTAEFKPFQEVDVMAKVSGYVKEIRVDVGDRVREGDLLATLEVPEMADDLRKSEAGVRHSQSEPRMRSHEPNRPTISRTFPITGSSRHRRKDPA
jgi:multidrug efflux pump subunit AcrA (membrane-fusion protein)